ncbi:P-loop containing nucleoside triphosphate hydrolase protein [Flagelloscypha sp. PMI_526]|nr:P-loop containing nucleoside triphosphate hydrolase protein [Flagelloscypha sp. PMI_526]
MSVECCTDPYRSSSAAIFTFTSEMAAPQIDCLVLGQLCAGKTSMIRRAVEGVFLEDLEPAIDDSWRVQRIFDNDAFEIELTDTSQMYEYQSLLKSHYQRAKVLLVCFSLVDPESFEYIMQTVHPLLINAKPTTPIILVGTKSDLWKLEQEVEELRQNHYAPISTSQIEALAQELGAQSYSICSAKNGEGIEEVLTSIIREFKRSQQVENTKKDQGQRTIGEKRKVLVNGKCAIM